MDNLNKLYNLRESLKDAGISIPEDLLQKIALQEREVIQSKLTDFQFAADLLFEDIDSPYEVIAKYDPKTGVAVFINHSNALSKPSSSNKLTKDEINTPAFFIKYIYGLDVGVKTKQDYIRCIDDESIVNVLNKITGKKSMFEVSDVILLRKVLKKVDPGYPHTTLKHYIKFLLQESILSRLTSQDNSSTSHRPKAKKKLVVSFNDGTIISDDNAAETMRKTVIKIGPQRIQKLGMMRCGMPFIADFKSDNERIARSQKPVGNNLYVITYSDAETKQKQLEEIAKRFGINMRVSIETI